MDNINTKIEDLRSRGIELIKDNHLAAAKELYIQICALAPEDVDAWYTLSNITGMLGDMEMAGECSRRVLELQNDHCEAHVNLGNVLLNQGKHAEAATEYQ